MKKNREMFSIFFFFNLALDYILFVVAVEEKQYTCIEFGKCEVIFNFSNTEVF